MKILVADDHPLIREALRNVLRELDDQVRVVEAQDCPTALSLVDEHPDLDLALLDLNLPGVGGFAALSELRKRYPAVPVVVLSAFDDRNNVMEALDRGAMGFISKSSSNEVMLCALRLVQSGGKYIPPQILGIEDSASAMPAQTAEVGGAQGRKAIRSASDLGLTERQQQVLALLMQGKSNKLICRELGVAERTVKIHVSAVLKALNVTSRTQAVIAAEHLGLRFDSLRGSSGDAT